MHIFILASTQELGRKLQASLAEPGDHCTVVTTWSAVSASLEKHTPSVIVVERTAFQRMELASLLSLTQPGRWPPVILAGEPGADARTAVPVARRIAGETPPFYQVGELRIDTRRKRATIGERWVALPPIQYRLLVALAQRPGEVIGSQELVHTVWGYDASEIEARELVKVHIRQIRRRLGLDPEQHSYIQSIRGFGYTLVPPEDA